ncbi:MAG: hypothetical protein ACOY4T_14370 [Pseudomonadota bacterium]
MFERLRLFASEVLLALAVAAGLGIGLVVAGIAAILGLMMLAAVLIAPFGAAPSGRKPPAGTMPYPAAGPDPATRPV